MADFFKGLMEKVRETFDTRRKQENDALLHEITEGDVVTTELAFAVLLVDLAMIDEKFDEREHAFVMSKLQEKFGLAKDEVDRLIEQAKTSIEDFRGPRSMIEHLRATLSLEEKKGIMELLDGLISADEIQDESELHLREAFAKLLGV